MKLLGHREYVSLSQIGITIVNWCVTYHQYEFNALMFTIVIQMMKILSKQRLVDGSMMICAVVEYMLLITHRIYSNYHSDAAVNVCESMFSIQTLTTTRTELQRYPEKILSSFFIFIVLLNFRIICVYIRSKKRWFVKVIFLATIFSS